ncbi:MAG: ROK family transcriptional regulator [Caldilineaceae bacterium]
MIKRTQKATRAQTKWHNSRLVLNTIYKAGAISRADIARQTKLTAATVSAVATSLIEDGLIEDGAAIAGARGKPPTLLKVVENAYHLLCLNLAGGVFRGAVVNMQGAILHRVELPVAERTGDDAVALAYALVDALLDKATSPIMGIGVGGPGITDPHSGRVLRSVNFGWYNLPLRDLLHARYKLPVHLANAGHAAVLAEYRYGRYREQPDLVVVNIGRDVGAGIVLNGQLFLGAAFGAGEIGHVTVVENGERCRCGNYGCLETLVSSRAIVQRARQRAQAHPASILAGLAPAADIDIETVIQAFELGDPHVCAIVDEVGLYLGIALANVVGVLSVSHILLTGRVTRFGEMLFTRINQEVNCRSLARVVSGATVEAATLGADIVILGAAALVLQHELGVH